MRKLIGLIAVVSALSVMGASASTASACEANYICGFTGNTYENQVISWACSGSGLTGRYYTAFHSAYNRCGNKTAWLRWNGNTVKCLNPGWEGWHVGYNEVWIAANYGSYC